MWGNPKVLSGHEVSLVPSAMLEYFGEEKKQVPICISSKFALSQQALGHFALYVCRRLSDSVTFASLLQGPKM